MATIMVIVTTSAPLTESTSACMTVGTVVTTVATVTAQLVSLQAVETASDEVLLNTEIMEPTEVSSVEATLSSAGTIPSDAAAEVLSVEIPQGLSMDVTLRCGREVTEATVLTEALVATAVSVARAAVV